MRFVGKPEVLRDTFLLETGKDFRQGTSMLTDEDMQSLVPKTLVLEAGETRVGLFAIRLDQLPLSELAKLRKVFPPCEYRTIKNRFRARKNRSNKQNQV